MNFQASAKAHELEPDSTERAALRDVDQQPRATLPAMFVVMLLIFLMSPVTGMYDGRFALLLSDGILHHSSTHLNYYKLPGPIPINGPCPPQLGDGIPLYQVDRLDGNVVYCYPNGGSILAVPFVALMETIGLRPASPSGTYNLLGEGIMQMLLAALLMAVLACVIFLTARLLLGASSSVLVALGAGLGTQIWSSASRTLWPQTWLIFLAGWVIYLLLKCECRGTKMRPVVLATLLSWMFFVRPMGAIAVACVSIYMLLRYPKNFVLFAATGALWFAGFLLYSRMTFGVLVPPYYLDVPRDWSNIPTALAGILISPSRGLFVFVPVTAFVLYLLVRYWRFVEPKPIAILAIAVAALHTALLAVWPVWWGGCSYGPRLLMDSVPWLAALAILGLAAQSSARSGAPRRLEAAIGAALLMVSVFMNGRGAISSSCVKWNDTVDVDRHPERIFDWSYPEFLAGLISPPKYLRKTEQARPLSTETREVGHG